MTSFDFEDSPTDETPVRPARRGGHRRFDPVWNILTFLVLLVVVCLAGAFTLIYINPRTGLNIFPPPTLPPRLVLPSPTRTSALPPTWTPTNTLEPTVTNTPHPTATLPPTPTFFTLVTPSATPTVTRPPAGYPYEVRKGTPQAITNIYHPELGCNWMGVGGQAVDMSGAPVIGLIVRLGGTLPGIGPLQTMMSLTGVALNYGRAGYEFMLGEKPIASKKSLWVQLLDQEGTPLSDPIYFDTFASCDKNLIVVDFKQVR